MENPLRHHHRVRATDQASFMERLAEHVASGLGTVAFVVTSTLIIIIWIFINAAGIVKFDKYPFILLNLGFSAQAFYTGALVIIAQKAQSRFEKRSEEANALHREELAQTQIRLLEQNTEMTERIEQMASELHEHIVQSA